jgi:hypothetical protein
MLRLVCLHSKWHYKILELYYTKLFTFRSHLMKANDSMLSSIAGFFSWSPTWTKVCFNFSKRSLKYHVSTFLLVCGFKGRCLVINLSYHTYILFIFNPFFYITSYMSWLATSYDCSSFTMLMWSYHWWSKYPFVSVPHRSECTITHDTFWDIIITLLWRMEHMFERRFLTFDLVTYNDEWTSLSPDTISRPWWMSSLLIQLAQLWCNEHQWW